MGAGSVDPTIGHFAQFIPAGCGRSSQPWSWRSESDLLCNQSTNPTHNDNVERHDDHNTTQDSMEKTGDDPTDEREQCPKPQREDTLCEPDNLRVAVVHTVKPIPNGQTRACDDEIIKMYVGFQVSLKAPDAIWVTWQA